MRWRALTAAGVLLAAGLAGCDDDAAPSPPPLDPSTSSPSSAAPTESPAPTMPAEAKGASAASAKAFVRYWINLLNHAGATGDTDELRALSPQCKACIAIADNLDELYANGGRIESKGWKIAGVAKPVPTDVGILLVDVAVDGSPQKIISPGTPTKRFPGGRSIKSFQLKRASGAWRVYRLDQT